jgi:hypothetical protein
VACGSTTDCESVGFYQYNDEQPAFSLADNLS